MKKNGQKHSDSFLLLEKSVKFLLSVEITGCLKIPIHSVQWFQRPAECLKKYAGDNNLVPKATNAYFSILIC